MDPKQSSSSSSSSSSKKDDPNMQWMYEGAKSMVNREDYLLGKKVCEPFLT
jgi:hypothetical protein